MNRDNYNNISPVSVLAPAVYSTDQNGGWVDMQGFDAASFLIHTGVGGITFDATNKIEWKMQHTDDDPTGSPVVTDVTSDEVLGPAVTGSGVVQSFVSAQAAAKVTKVGYRGAKRYVRLVTDFSGTHGSGTPVAITCVRARANVLPT